MTDPTLTNEAQHTLLHTLGLEAGREGTPYRDSYVTGPKPSADVQELVDLGLFESRRRPGFLPAGELVFGATLTGWAVALRLHAASLPKLTRAQRRYREWLNVADATNETFGEFLRRKGHRHAC